MAKAWNALGDGQQEWRDKAKGINDAKADAGVEAEVEEVAAAEVKPEQVEEVEVDSDDAYNATTEEEEEEWQQIH